MPKPAADNYRLTRTDNGGFVDLPSDLQWTDEWSWNAVAQTAQYSLGGSLIVQQSVKRGGRPITLAGDWAWVDYADIVRLRDWTDVPELPLRLAHPDGRVFDVMFRQHDNSGLTAEPVRFAVPETAGDRYRLTLRLMIV